MRMPNTEVAKTHVTKQLIKDVLNLLICAVHELKYEYRANKIPIFL